MPMKQVFTPKKMRPSAQTIYFIKQIAYSYHTMVQNGKLKVCYPNLKKKKDENNDIPFVALSQLH